MADRKISDLTALTTPASGDYLPIVDISEAAAANKNKRITIEELFRGAPDGTFGAPGFAFESDPNTGIYSPGADQLAISTNGTGRLFVDASGNVGVGTSAPQATLDCRGPIITTNGTTRWGLIGTDTDGAYLGTAGINHPWIFKTGNGSADVERMRLTSTGTVNIVGAGTAGSTQAISFNGSAPVNSLVVDSSGRVGIGTSAPGSVLHVNTASGDCKQTISASAGTTSAFTAFVNTTVTTVGTENSTGGNLVSGSSAYATILSNSGAYPIQFGTNNTVRATLDSSGRLGIGTTSVNSLFEVRGTTNNQDIIHLSNTAGTFAVDGSATNSIRVTCNGNSNWANLDIKAFQTIFTQNNTERARIDSSGRLLVGTSSSRSVGGVEWNQQTEGTNYTGASFVTNANSAIGSYVVLAKSRGTAVGSNTIVQNGDTLGVVSFAAADGTDVATEAANIAAFVDGTPGANDMPGRLVFSTTADSASSPTERMRIRNTGQAWINQTANISGIGDGCILQVTGTGSDWAAAIENTNASPYGINIRHTTDVNGTGNEFIAGRGNNTVRFAFRSNGGLANYQANDVNLSDINTKKDITPAAGTWDCIKEWEIVNYRYKDQPDDADLNLGVIAQQVAKSCPEVVTVFQEAKEATEDQPAQEERLGIKEQQMYWMAIKALQEAQVRIEQLEAKVAALESA